MRQGGGTDSLGLFNTGDVLAEVYDGDHADHVMEGAEATGEVTVHKHKGNPPRRGWVPSHKI